MNSILIYSQSVTAIWRIHTDNIGNNNSENKKCNFFKSKFLAVLCKHKKKKFSQKNALKTMIIQGEKEPRACWVITASKRKRCAKKSEQPRETSAKGQQKKSGLDMFVTEFFSSHREKAKKKIDNLKRTLNQPSLSFKLLNFFYQCFANLKMIRKLIDYNDRGRISRIWFASNTTFSFATTSPLIKLGGTPGPGTVNWPV